MLALAEPNSTRAFLRLYLLQVDTNLDPAHAREGSKLVVPGGRSDIKR